MTPPLFVEWYPEHVVSEPDQMQANLEWAERCYRLLKDGGIVGTSHGAYVKRDGGLYRLRADVLKEES